MKVIIVNSKELINKVLKTWSQISVEVLQALWYIVVIEFIHRTDQGVVCNTYKKNNNRGVSRSVPVIKKKKSDSHYSPTDLHSRLMFLFQESSLNQYYSLVSRCLPVTADMSVGHSFIPKSMTSCHENFLKSSLLPVADIGLLFLRADLTSYLTTSGRT